MTDGDTPLDDVSSANKVQLQIVDLLLSSLSDQCRQDNEFPVNSIFLYISNYLGFDNPKIDDKPIVTIDNEHAGSYMVTVSEVFGPVMLDKIIDYLKALREKGRPDRAKKLQAFVEERYNNGHN